MQQAACCHGPRVAGLRPLRILLLLSSLGLVTGEVSAQGEPGWLRPRATPGGSTGHAMAYDVVRQRVVLFGGYWGVNSYSSETWEWNGDNWTQRSPSNSPSARHSHAMAYDVARQRVVLFGGWDRTGYSNETWEWDGDNWTKRSPSNSPSTRHGHAMVYDIARQRVVLFGGTRIESQGTVFLGDTWEWDGNYWTKRSPTNSPSTRHGHAMVYDIARQRVVLFGGCWAYNSYSSDTWEWDGNSWTQRSPTNSPSARHSHAMAYDVARQRVVLFGGGDANNPLLWDTWEWDGNSWARRSPANSPMARNDHAMAYDAARQHVVLFGGYAGGALPLSHSDTWEWDGSNWTQPVPQSPSRRHDHAMAYDVARQCVVLFGGWDNYSAFSDTWEWDGHNWSLRSPARSPTARYGHAMAYDVARQRVVLFGGSAPGALVHDTWEWDGHNWSKRSPTRSPSERYHHAMAYDIARERVVLFGGRGAASSATWEWDGDHWIQLTPANSPSPRYGHAMSYDVARQRVVLFGGAGTGYPRDTWEWDGRDWTQLWSTQGPGSRFHHAMAYDIVRQRVVLFGGVLVAPRSFVSADTWEWDGLNWSQRSTTNGPSARASHAMAYDIARQRVVLFGGTGGGDLDDTWHYSGHHRATTQPFGSACSGSTSSPILTSETPYLGHPRFGLELIGARPASACVFGLSATRQDQPIPPCTLYLGGPIVPLLAVTNWAGFARSPGFPVPLSTNLRGLTLHAQAFVADPQGPVGGLTFSAGLKLVLGD